MLIYNELLKKAQRKHAINVAIVGAGWFGGGLVRELLRWPGMNPKVIIDKNVGRVISNLSQMGIRKNNIELISSAKEYREKISNGRYIVSEKIEILKELDSIDIIFEATGNIETGTNIALWAIEGGKHFITVNAEMDATVGFVLNQKARERGVVYSNSDGDQPGVLATMIEEVRLLGFDVVVAGNCKGYLNYHKTPDDIIPWVRPGHNPQRVVSFTDGTKQSLELVVLANATGLVPDKRGMHGPKTTKQTLVDDFLKIISQEGIVDFVMGIDGINQGAGVFVIGKRDQNSTCEDMDYLKKGKGPYYLFFRDHHLCYFEAPKSIADAVLFGIPTIAPQHKVADCLTVAKRDLKAGEKLDGIGGYTVYGLIDRAEIVRGDSLLPVGLSEYAVLKKNVEKDTPITYQMVDFPEDNIVLKLRREQDNLCLDYKDVDIEKSAEKIRLVS